MTPTQLTHVTDGVHRLSHANVNCYLIEDEDGVTLVDAGLPVMWSMLIDALEATNRRPDEIRALILTHGQFDHVGFARRAQQEFDIPVLVHPKDSYLAAHPYSYRSQSNRLLYPLRRPRSFPVLGRMLAAGALSVTGVDDTEKLAVGTPLPLPGSPVALHSPGHTRGHCIIHLPDRDTVISGDALVTLDPYTGATGPRIVASAATENTRGAIDSLLTVAATGATTVLPGHGHPWTGGAQHAVDLALEAGER
ncbi:MBL fold metallo-hydrolase [Dietzia natronolimnaea]|uniref:MBL fold metallo-hydrolase n=1 Tax=Dietzia natronolimnaea TaxID=161920 RepID=UPI0015FDB5AF|nr:MBL fold metallo-hydrolase [Dietzia natronolimnaea]MBB1037645.1 MBL fold metallo-hydrolase [Dietzia natronolimnaea]